MLKKSVPYSYFILHETLVPQELAEKNLKILNENKIIVGGNQIITLTYTQILQSLFKNWNGRTYALEDITKSIENNPVIQHDLKMKSWTAEYGHPIIEKGQNELVRQMTIFPPNACNTINKWWVDGNLIMGECTTLADGFGEMLKNRLLSGFPAMASSRAIGGVDGRGKVLPGYTLITYDTVIRPSHKEAYTVPNTEKSNIFGAPSGNSMNECASPISDIKQSEAFKSFVLTEGAEKVNILCDALSLDYNTLTIDGNNIKINRINENAIDTIIIPIKKLVSAEYHNLFY